MSLKLKSVLRHLENGKQSRSAQKMKKNLEKFIMKLLQPQNEENMK